MQKSHFMHYRQLGFYKHRLLFRYTDHMSVTIAPHFIIVQIKKKSMLYFVKKSN